MASKAEGTVTTVVVPVPDVAETRLERTELKTWNLGPMGPLTREDIHEDAL